MEENKENRNEINLIVNNKTKHQNSDMKINDGINTSCSKRYPSKSVLKQTKDTRMRSIHYKKQQPNSKLHQIRYQYENFRTGVSRKRAKVDCRREAHSTGRIRTRVFHPKDVSTANTSHFQSRMGHRTNRLDHTTIPECSQ